MIPLEELGLVHLPVSVTLTSAQFRRLADWLAVDPTRVPHVFSSGSFGVVVRKAHEEQMRVALKSALKFALEAT